jgi:hypothetical protein
MFVITYGEPMNNMEDQLPHTILFLICIDWYGHIIKDIGKGYFEDVCQKKNKKTL